MDEIGQQDQHHTRAAGPLVRPYVSRLGPDAEPATPAPVTPTLTPLAPPPYPGTMATPGADVTPGPGHGPGHGPGPQAVRLRATRAEHQRGGTFPGVPAAAPRPRRSWLVPVLLVASLGAAALVWWSLQQTGDGSPQPVALPPSATTPVTTAPPSAAQTSAAGAAPRTGDHPTDARTSRPRQSAPASAGGPATPSASTSTASSSPSADGTLSPGSTGPQVSRLQTLLIDQGKTSVTVNGRYDQATEEAVREIQQDRGITADPPGVYGPATRAALDPSG
ncbi:peptidoglycan-binding protein [Streptacidiphilus sp. EB129]|uniref:peptidoglycan-binding domain-containing protein n=1 Tax=Streptacidiphilus sp. EB129 TaxID=3156262 RepID=UPI003516975E